MSATAPRPGRSCPLHYRYSPAVFRRGPDLAPETLYVAGGIHGNPFALEALWHRVADEPGTVAVVFNGDFHWFDVAPEVFARVHRATLRGFALRGNVETELADARGGADCGCACPEWVSEAEVVRSNRIMAMLRSTPRGSLDESALDRLAALPMHAVAAVGGCRIGIVHGDHQSLSGWQFGERALGAPSAQAITANAFEAAGVDVFASSHTCLPALRRFTSRNGERAVINNGAAGMPNFRGTTFGLATRIGLDPAADALYGTRVRDTRVEAIPLFYDAAAWERDFLRQWPAGSPAHLSYYSRIVGGPAYERSQAARPDAA